MSVHHEGAVPDDGLVQRGAIEQQQSGVCLDINHQLATASFHDRQFSRADRMVVAETNGAFDHKQCGGMPFWQLEGDLVMCVQTHVPDVHRRESARRAMGVIVVSRDNAHLACPLRQCHLGDLSCGNTLVARGRHLVSGRQVDPKLDHLKGATLLGERRAMVLLVDQARGGRHPLHVTGTYGATTA